MILTVIPFMTETSQILNNVSYSHKVNFLTTEKLAGFKTKSWQVFEQKVGRFYAKNRVPPPNSKIHSRPVTSYEFNSHKSLYLPDSDSS